MIFNNDTLSGGAAIQESKYNLGLEGALMHVYENECNYNAIIKSVGLSEMKYYQETGKDLFLNEAGAFGSFIEKVKAFFRKVIEKIKAIFKKFAAVMDRFFMDDKKFAKKYRDQVLRNVSNAKDFEISGYTFEGLDKFATDLGKGAKTMFENELSTVEDALKDSQDSNKIGLVTDNDPKSNADNSSDALEKMKDENRGDIVGNGSGSLDSSEFHDKLNDICYGNDKEKTDITIDSTKMRTLFDKLEGSKTDIKTAENTQKGITDAIEKVIKGLDKLPKTYEDNRKSKNDPAGNKESDKINRYVNNRISILQSLSNDYTTAFGVVVGAIKDRNRQAKAFAVKCLSYKHEAATVSESSVDDIFAGVQIR